MQSLTASLWLLSLTETAVLFLLVANVGKSCSVTFPPHAQGYFEKYIYGVFSFALMAPLCVIFVGVLIYAKRRARQLRPLVMPESFCACVSSVVWYAFVSGFIVNVRYNTSSQGGNTAEASSGARFKAQLLFFWFHSTSGIICAMWIGACDAIRAAAFCRRQEEPREEVTWVVRSGAGESRDEGGAP